jgi:Uma2 family endonuclease
MVEQARTEYYQIRLPQTLPAGEIVAVDVSEADYMAHYAASHHEWIKGVVIKMSPVRLVHDQLVQYLRSLLGAYISRRPLDAQIVGDPFVMRLSDSRREPDVQVILGENRANLRETYVNDHQLEAGGLKPKG